MPTLPSTDANYKKFIYDIQFPGIWLKFGIILNDF